MKLGKLSIGTTRRASALLRGQGAAARDPRPGPARREDPAQEDPEPRWSPSSRRCASSPCSGASCGRRPARERGGADQSVADAPDPRLDLHTMTEEFTALRPPPRAPHRRHRAALLGRARQRPHGPLRGRPGDPARPRPRHLSLRHLLQPDRRRGLCRRRGGAGRHRRGLGGRQGLRDPGRRRPLPDRAGRRGRAPHARARPRVRDDDRARAALRLDGPGRPALRRPAQQDERADDHQARRAERDRPAAGRCPLPLQRGRRLRRSPTTSRSSTRPSPSTKSCPASTTTSPPAAARRTCRRGARLPRFIADSVGVPIRLVGVGPSRDQVVWIGDETAPGA